MASIFTRIVRGEIPAHKLAEDEQFLSFLDINPLVEGHALVIPKQEIDRIFDLDDKLLGDLFAFAKKVAVGIEQVVECDRIGISVIGLEVPHAHVHLIPIRSVSDMNFARPKLNPTQEDLARTASRIREAIDQIS